MKQFPLFLFIFVSSLSLLSMPFAQEGPKRQELDGAEYRLKNLEKKVERAKGKPFRLGHDDKRGLEKIITLSEKYPSHSRVQELKERASKALLASKGKIIDVTAKMLAYRKKGEELIQKFHKISEEKWNSLKSELQTKDGTITKPFPQKDPLNQDVNSMIGKWIFLDDIQYPMNEFKHHGQSWLYVGKPSIGFYYVSLSSRSWKGSYEALRRYKRTVGGDIPQEVHWIVAGQIQDIALMIPEAGETPTMDAQFGWVIEPRYIYVPNYILTQYDSKDERSGKFIGEDRLEEIKGPMYSVKEIPADVTPEQLTRIYITAIKEKNYKLWKKCIDPERLKTEKAVALANYHWDWHQIRWNSLYAKAEIAEKAKIEIIQGGDGLSDLERKLLPKEELEKLQKHSDPIVYKATIRLRLFNERGKQALRIPQKFYLRKYQNGRWFAEVPWLPN